MCSPRLRAVNRTDEFEAHLSQRMEFLKSAEIEKVVTVVRPKNDISIRNQQKAGTRVIKRFRVLRILERFELVRVPRWLRSYLATTASSASAVERGK